VLRKLWQLLSGVVQQFAVCELPRHSWRLQPDEQTEPCQAAAGLWPGHVCLLVASQPACSSSLADCMTV